MDEHEELDELARLGELLVEASQEALDTDKAVTRRIAGICGGCTSEHVLVVMVMPQKLYVECMEWQPLDIFEPPGQSSN